MRRLLMIAAVMLAGLGTPALAAPPERPMSVMLAAGKAQVDVDGYNRPTMYALGFQYTVLPALSVGITRYGFNDFERRGLSTVTLALEGTEVAVAGNLRFRNGMTVQPLLGYMAYDLEGKSFLGKTTEEDYSATAGLTLRFPVGSRLGVMTDMRRAFSVSESAVDWVALGLYLRF